MVSVPAVSIRSAGRFGDVSRRRGAGSGCRGARLLLVHAFRPPVAPGAADYGQAGFGTPRDLYADRMVHGNALIVTAIDQAVGRMPGDVAMEQQVISGRPAVELASLAWGRRPARARIPAPGIAASARARLGGACLRARCPVVIVPEPSPGALPACLWADLDRGHRFGWVPHRGEQTAS